MGRLRVSCLPATSQWLKTGFRADRPAPLSYPSTRWLMVMWFLVRLRASKPRCTLAAPANAKALVCGSAGTLLVPPLVTLVMEG